MILNFLFVDHKSYFKAADFGGKILLQRAIGLIPRPGGNQLKLGQNLCAMYTFLVF